jgi:hypothetical protein
MKASTGHHPAPAAAETATADPPDPREQITSTVVFFRLILFLPIIPNKIHKETKVT